jgi:hypothetical protein
MKHLRRYNESLTEDEVDELTEFCETSLAYLLDDGYEVFVQREWNVGFHVIFKLEDSEDFYWNDIKDYFIPFLQLLSRRYKFGIYAALGNSRRKGISGEVYINADNPSFYTVEQVINDENDTIENISSINVKVIGKK